MVRRDGRGGGKRVSSGGNGCRVSEEFAGVAHDVTAFAGERPCHGELAGGGELVVAVEHGVDRFARSGEVGGCLLSSCC